MATTNSPTPVPVPSNNTTVPLSQIDRAPAPVPDSSQQTIIPLSSIDRQPGAVNPAINPGIYVPAPPPPPPPLNKETSAAENPYSGTSVPSIILPIEEQPVEEQPAIDSGNIPNSTPVYIQVDQNGNLILARATVLNFTGSGVTVTATDSTAVINIPGGGSAALGNWAFDNNTQYNLNGGAINNSDLAHGATAGIFVPANGSDSATNIFNTYGNVILTAGQGPSPTVSWIFDRSGNLVLPSNTASINYANGTPYGGSGGSGTQGATGSQGIEGTQGATGAQGIIGLGIQGPTGTQGATGTGSTGAQGIIGAQGTTGAGVQGATGVQGTSGAQGITGVQGASGSGSAAGANTEIQYNDNGAFAGSSGLTYNQSTQTLTASYISAPDGNTSVLFNDEGVIGAAAGFNYEKNAGMLFSPGITASGNPDSGINAIYAGVGGYTVLGSSVLMQLTSNINTYSQINQQNVSSGNRASADYIITADNGTDATYFLDVGLGSSNYAFPGFFEDTTTNNDAYMYVVGSSATGPATDSGPGNLIVGSTNGQIKFFIGNTAQANVIATITANGYSIDNIYSLNEPVVHVHDDLETFGDMTAVGYYLNAGGSLINLGGNVVDLNSQGNLQLEADGAAWLFDTTGNLTLPSNTAYINYANGTPYNSGIQGITGAQGSTGPQGVQGITGQDGTSVTIIGSVPDAHVIPPGDPQILLSTDFPSAVAGNGVISEDDGHLWVYDGSVWIDVGSVKGPQGTTGAQGAQGIEGAQGVQGIEGAQGATGAQGFNGSEGTQGATGAQGFNGTNGAQGTQGAQGTTGTQGTTGAQGSTGSQGTTGTGTQGATGSQGTTGAQGTLGTQGSVGPSTTINATNNTSTAALYPVMVGAAGSNQTANVTTSKFVFDASTGNLSVVGNIVNSTGDIWSQSGQFRTTAATANIVNSTPTTVNIAGGASIVTNIGNASGVVSLSGNVQGNTNGFAIGYRDIPQVTFSANATTALSDAGKHYYSTSGSALTLTIANSAVANFAVGAAINIVNQGTGTITVAQGSGVTMYLAGNATSGNRTVASYGVATIQKVATDTWFIVGVGVS